MICGGQGVILGSNANHVSAVARIAKLTCLELSTGPQWLTFPIDLHKHCGIYCHLVILW